MANVNNVSSSPSRFEEIARPEKEDFQLRLGPQLGFQNANNETLAEAGVGVTHELLKEGVRPFISAGHSFLFGGKENLRWQLQAGPGGAIPIHRSGDTFVQGIVGLNFFVQPFNHELGLTPHAGLKIFGSELPRGLGFSLNFSSPELSAFRLIAGLELPLSSL